jgi:predicted Zn-dependent peptidase
MVKMASRCFLLLVLLSLSLFCALTSAEGNSSIPLVNPDELRYPQIQFAPPQAQRVILDNGIILYIFEDHELPLLNISAVIRTGSNFDTVGKEGLAELTGTLLRTGGTQSISADAVDEALDFFAGSLSVSMSRDSGSISLSVLKDNLDEGLNIFSQIIINPAFEESKLTLAKNLKIEDLRRTADDPQRLAFRELKRFLYRDNPSGRLPSITSINTIQRADLIHFYKQFFYPKNIMIAVTGDISKEQAIAKIQQYFGSWDESMKHYSIPPTPAKQKGHIYFLSKEIPQSIIISAQLAPGKKNPDAYPFEVLDFILGSGGFKSRIFQQIRNNLGLAYSTGSFYTKLSEYGVFGAYAITKSETTAKVLSNIQAIIMDTKTNVVDKKELEGAIKSINNNFIFSFLSAEQIAHQQLMMEYDNLPEDYLENYRDRIAKVHTEDLMRVANKYLSADGAVILVVGNENAYDQLVSSFRAVSRIKDSL